VTRQLGAAGRATLLALALAAAVAPSADAAADGPQVLDRSRVPVSLDKSTSLQVRNPGPPSLLSATASAPVAVAWADEEPACPASGMAVRTAGAVATGELVQLWLRRCDKTDLAGAVVALWAAPDGPVTQLPVEAAADPAAQLPLPAAIELRKQAGQAASVTTCLPGAAAGVVGLVAHRDDVLPVRLTRVERTCPAGSGATVAVEEVGDEPGKFEGKIDVNGTSGGGELTFRLFARRAVLVFLGLLLAGMLVATVVSWWIRFGRPWGFVDEHAARQRSTAWKVREGLRERVEPVLGAFPARLDAVSRSAPKQPAKALDVALASYRGDAGRLRRLLEPPPQDRLEGGTGTAELAKACATYAEIAALAGELVEWMGKAEPGHPASPTVSAIKTAVNGPGSDLQRLETDLSQAWNAVQRLCELLDWTAAIKREAAARQRPDLVEQVDAIADEVWTTRMGTSAEALDNKLAAVVRELPNPAAVPRPALELTADQAITQAFAGRASAAEDPAKAAARIARRNLGSELTIALISLVVAVMSGYAAPYASNPAWGSGGDMLAALTWAVTAASAIQVARYLTTRTPA
jgi:hypothetical protein